MKMSHWAFCLQAVTANPACVDDSRPCCYLLVVGIKWFLTSSSGDFHIPVLQPGPWEGEILTSLSTCSSLGQAGLFFGCDFCQRLSNINSTHLALKAGEFHMERSAMGWSSGTAAWTQSLARIPLLTSNEKLNTIKTILALCIIMQTPATLTPYEKASLRCEFCILQNPEVQAC